MIDAGQAYDLALVAVRAEQVEALLPQLAASGNVKLFLFIYNRGAGAQAIASSLGRDRYLLGFPGACGTPEGEVIRFRLIPEHPTTLGEPDGMISPRLKDVAARLRRAGFPVAISRRMDDWLKTHAVFVTCIAGAIYQAGGRAADVARTPKQVASLVRGIREGFNGLSRAGVSIVPRKLALLLGLPYVPTLYWRNFLSRPAAELMFAAHARRAPEEMWALVTELRSIVPFDPQSSPALTKLWRAVEEEAVRVAARHEPKTADGRERT
jgi:2-dehydropantoate 2-reductase